MRGERIGLDWSEKGREPFQHALQLLLHPAEGKAEAGLRDLKGYTLETSGGERWWIRVWNVAKVYLGCG